MCIECSLIRTLKYLRVDMLVPHSVKRGKLPEASTSEHLEPPPKPQGVV